MIDFRSDTITKPTLAMRQAMAQAEVGDDVFGDDPTVLALEARTAEILGKEASIYMPSGTMTNQVALRVHTEPGDEVLLESNAHIYYYEAGAPAAFAGVSCRLLPGVRGIFGVAEVQAALRPLNVHYPPSRLICLENTHNRGGGSVWPLAQIQEIAHFAQARGLKMHLDGARLWNACVATGWSPREYAQAFDSVSVCFSKGLGAPVGSALAGSRALVERARRFRKQLGGGMRQAGILAAGALYALEHHRTRLVEDHANAQALAQGLAAMQGVEINPAEVQTNIVLFRSLKIPAETLAELLKNRGVWMLAMGPEHLRAVTSLEVEASQIASALQIIHEVLQEA